MQVAVGEAAAAEMKKVHGMDYTVGTSPQILCKTRAHALDLSLLAVNSKQLHHGYMNVYYIYLLDEA